MKKAITLLFLLLLFSVARADGQHPVFTGAPYVVYNNGVCSFDNVFLGGDEFVQYSPRDELGRVGPALAYLGPKRFQAGRESIQNQTPTGFINAKYDFISGGSLYHRCHLIAHRMTSSGEYAENLFTGTAFLNLGIMSKVEGQVADYISRTQNHVLYKVTPDFYKNELVCRGIIIEAESIEDTEIRICYYCFNVQPGVVIDYETGTSTLAQYATTEPEGELLLISDADDLSIEPETRQNPALDLEEVQVYVLNLSRKRFHLPTCKGVSDMKPENRQDYTGSRDALISMGYKPCGTCNP